MMENLSQIIVLSGLWIAWCTMHSLLISQWIVAWARNYLKDRYAYYRLLFNLFSLLTLIPILMYQFILDESILFDWPGAWKLLKMIMYLSAFVLFYGGYRVYDSQYVLGFKQIREFLHGSRQESMPFKTSGVLQYVRHPWYSGGIILIWAFGKISDVSLTMKVILTAYFIIGTILEERKLIAEIGEPYRQYCRRVPMMIPWRKKHKKIL
jgi:hypothetical protein